MKTNRKNNVVAVESLEGRTLMSASALNITQVPFQGGTQLRVNGTAGNDQITVKQTTAGLVVGNTGFSQTVNGSFNNLYVNGGLGNNSVVLDATVTIDATIFGGAGKNYLKGGTGNVTFVTLGSIADTIIGGAGHDTFWTDNNTAEKVQGQQAGEQIHRVGGFVNAGPAASGKKASTAVAKALKSAASNQPAVDSGVSYKSFSSKPIFASTGPSADDIFQGSTGDCYFLSVLSSTAKLDANLIRSSILDLGDGTEIVALNKGGKQVFVHEDSMLPVNADGSLAYAGLGKQDSTWVALMEKAWCYVRTNSASYAAIDAGWMTETYTALGVRSTSSFTASSASALLSQIQKNQSAGQSVTFATTGTTPETTGLMAAHAYTVISVGTDSKGAVSTLTLRNPWGCDSNGNGNGYVTVTAAQAFKAFTGMVSATM